MTKDAKTCTSMPAVAGGSRHIAVDTTERVLSKNERRKVSRGYKSSEKSCNDFPGVDCTECLTPSYDCVPSGNSRISYDGACGGVYNHLHGGITGTRRYPAGSVLPNGDTYTTDMEVVNYENSTGKCMIFINSERRY